MADTDNKTRVNAGRESNAVASSLCPPGINYASDVHCCGVAVPDTEAGGQDSRVEELHKVC